VKSSDRWIYKAVKQGLSFDIQVAANGEALWVHASDQP
jgi:hypothetical protein